MKFDRYYVEDFFDEQPYTAGVVRKDNETILTEEGFKKLKFHYHKNGSAIVKLLRVINAISLAFSCTKRSIVVFHFPFHAGIYKLLARLLKWRGARIIALIIDIDGVRDNNQNLLKREIAILEKFDCLIVHNNAMINFLQQYISETKMIPIEIFDYPFAGNIQLRKFAKSVCIAANFVKATFVYDLGKLNPLQFFFYGSGYDETKQHTHTNILFKGVFKPNILPSVAEGSFGLVWDGDSIEQCHEYLKINNPHKLSLYLAAGMPVIVWEYSAVAAFVKTTGAGITVQSLLEIDSKLNALSPGEYDQMKQNALAVAEKLHKGFYLKKAIEKAALVVFKNTNLQTAIAV